MNQFNEAKLVGRTKFRGKYRIKSARLKHYDYSSDGAYFITICTKNRGHFFGEIGGNEMQYTDLGRIANECWVAIPKHFPFVALDEWVVMPNHVHGILIFDHDNECVNVTANVNVNRRDAIFCVSTETTETATGNQFGEQSCNLASVIRGFKIGVTKYARKNADIYDVWQPRFHDRIVRSDDELGRIRKYIIDNLVNWERDRNNAKKCKAP